MKVIKSGRWGDWKTEVNCRCGAALEVFAGDLRVMCHPTANQINDRWFSAIIMCAECGYPSKVDAEQDVLKEIYRQQEARTDLIASF